MNSLSITLILIGICIAAIILIAMAKPIKIVLGMVLNGLFGIAGIVIINAVLAPIGINIGINILTVGFTAVLGLPGLCALVLISGVI